MPSTQVNEDHADSLAAKTFPEHEERHPKGRPSGVLDPIQRQPGSQPSTTGRFRPCPTIRG